MAPTNTQRVYVTGVTNSPRAVHFYRSDDGGTTLNELGQIATLGLQSAYIAAVDPTNADTVYVRGDVPTSPADAASTTLATALLRSTDGGMTFVEIARAIGYM